MPVSGLIKVGRLLPMDPLVPEITGGVDTFRPHRIENLVPSLGRTALLPNSLAGSTRTLRFCIDEI